MIPKEATEKEQIRRIAITMCCTTHSEKCIREHLLLLPYMEANKETVGRPVFALIRGTPLLAHPI